ncbi:MAG: hypothetical protein WCF94_01800 [bacterium]
MKATNKKLIVSLVLMLALWAIAGVAFFVIWNKLDDTNTKIADTKIELGKQANIDDLKKVAQNNSGVMADLKTRIVPVDGDVDLIDNLEKLGKMVGVEFTIDSIKEQELSNKNISGVFGKTIEEAKIRILAEGSWSKLIKVWSLLQNYHYDVDFSAIDLNLTSADEGKGVGAPVWSAVFDVVILKYK